MIERLAILALVALVVLGVSLLVRATARSRVERTEGRELSPVLRRLLAPHDRGILYFYGPHCATCAQQALALEKLDNAIPIVRLDATLEREAARDLAIMTVPSTAVIAAGRVAAVNLGYTSGPTLLSQLETIGS